MYIGRESGNLIAAKSKIQTVLVPDIDQNIEDLSSVIITQQNLVRILGSFMSW